jgi:glycosyltransferase involved in cell wall biosynthesis
MSGELNLAVLHHGNVAQNGYNNAKFLRRLSVAADVVCDETEALAQPEWEDADLAPGVDGMAPWPIDMRIEGWERPDWVITPRPIRRLVPGLGRLRFTAALARQAPALRRLRERFLQEGHDVELRDLSAAYWAVWLQSLRLGDLTRLYRGYEVVQAYATHAILPMIVAPERPFVAYEHGTLRELPFENSWRGRLLSVAYRRAAAVIITNADVITSARRLGLRNTTFIPHPVDETKYTPDSSDLGRELRAHGHGPILLAPARQDWREKRNDVIVKALSALVRGGYANTLLMLGAWGTDEVRTRALVEELGLERNVRWTPPVPKLRLIELYRAADVVLDQFTFGTFGVLAPEAMACERPVVMAFDRSLHEWCFPKPPPIVDAREERSVGEALRRLADDPEERARLGRAGRAWVERYHGWRLVAERQCAIYEELLHVSG